MNDEKERTILKSIMVIMNEEVKALEKLFDETDRPVTIQKEIDKFTEIRQWAETKIVKLNERLPV